MRIGYLTGLLFLALCCACSSSTETGSGSTETGSSGLALTTTADFTASAASSLSSMLTRFVTTLQCADEPSSGDQDTPALEDGLDCDGDAGLVSHVTPSQYALAFKHVMLVPADIEGEDSTALDLIADTGTLAQSEVVSFTDDDSSESIIIINPSDLTAGTFSGLEAEMYYFQMTFPVGGTERHVRIYMSDDDFAAEGSLGHHQGDITFVDEDGTELGWVDPTWTTEALSGTRGESQNGAGGTDAETGHDRGFFGNAEFWNEIALDQGSGQDIYLVSLAFDENLEIPDPATITNLTTITTTFSVADTFFYEDFSPQGTGFFPDTGGEATSEGAAWAPLLPVMAVTVTTE